MTLLYPFKTPPYAHQLRAWEISRDRTEFALHMEMGTGKTKVLLDTAAWLFDQGKITRLLVFANKGSYLNWVRSEIPIHLPDHIRRRVAYWDADAGKAHQEELERIHRPEPLTLSILIMNTEALAFQRSLDFALRFVTPGSCLAAVDESTMIKNEKAARTRAAYKIRDRATYRRTMTGSPITKSPLDLYAQTEFLRPGCLGFGSYYTFRNRFAILVTKTAAGRSFKSVVGYQNLDELQRLLDRFSFRVTKAECLDLPPKVYTVRDVALTPEQRETYERLRKTAVAELQAGGVVTAPLVITRLLRLHQVVCGHVADDDGQVHALPSNRVPALLDTLEEAAGKVIIWANYRHDIEIVASALRQAYGPESVITYYGDTSTRDRAQAIADFQDRETRIPGRPGEPEQVVTPRPGRRFFVGNQKTGGYGITLTAADLVIYYSNSYDLELRLQSEDRAHRIGQTQSVTYVDLVARGTVDEKIMKALREKKKLAAEVLGDEWQDLFAPLPF